MTAPTDPLRSREFRRALRGWFRLRKRDLPWRRTLDPYAIWISEVMLQQTQVATVLSYYEPWMRHFPDVETLAAAGLDDVLMHWQGMGYYGRARTLHRAAGIIVRQHGGKLPRTCDRLGEIPSFGPYTAGAVASIAFGEAVPAVDGNVARVISRVLGLSGHSSDPILRRSITEILKPVVPQKNPGEFNQALMELGATVCRPQIAHCNECPVSAMCASREKILLPAAAGKKDSRPVRTIPVLRWTAFLVPGGRGGFLYRQRPMKGLFSGLWELPTLERHYEPKGGLFLGEIEHRLTHRTIRLHVYRLRYLPRELAGTEYSAFRTPPAVSVLVRKALVLAEGTVRKASRPSADRVIPGSRR